MVLLTKVNDQQQIYCAFLSLFLSLLPHVRNLHKAHGVILVSSTPQIRPSGIMRFFSANYALFFGELAPKILNYARIMRIAQYF